MARKAEQEKINKQSTVMGIILIAVLVFVIVFAFFSNPLTKWAEEWKANREAKNSSSMSIPEDDYDEPEDTGYPENEEQLGPDYQLSAPQAGDLIATITTSKGVMRFKLFPDNASFAVENFTAMARDGYYNGKKFAEIIDAFGVKSEALEETTFGGPFKSEFSKNLHNYFGALGYNAEKDANISTFHIITAGKVPDEDLDVMRGEEAKTWPMGFSEAVVEAYANNGGNPRVDGYYVVFGQLFEGKDVLEAISKIAVVFAPTEDEFNEGAEPDYTPLEDITIISVVIETY